MASRSAPDLTPAPLRLRPVRRTTQLLAGLVLYGVSTALQLRGALGLNPWDVLHQGLVIKSSLSFGTVSALVGLVVLLLWIPLRQRPGVGTVANVVVVAVAVDVSLALLPVVDGWPARIALLVAGVVLNGLATAAYVGARLGPGPRDGLMTGLHRRTGLSLRLVRTGIEVLVLSTGWLLGGGVGVGTVLYALAIGPLTQAFLPWVAVRLPAPAAASALSGSPPAPGPRPAGPTAGPAADPAAGPATVGER